MSLEVIFSKHISMMEVWGTEESYGTAESKYHATEESTQPPGCTVATHGHLVVPSRQEVAGGLLLKMSIDSFTTELSNISFHETFGFYLMGIPDLKDSRYFFVFLSLVYMITLLANFTLMALIYFKQTLHTPKYITVFNLAIVDIAYNSVLIPQMIQAFLLNSNYIDFKACFIQMFFIYYITGMEAFSLAIMAYDRLLAICFPLCYLTLNTNAKMFIIIGITWICLLIPPVYAIILLTRLSYCRSREIYSCYCEFRPTYILACDDVSHIPRNAIAISTTLLYTPLIFIIVTYTVIVAAVIKLKSAGSRWKVFSTCASHLLLVVIFFVPLMVIYMTDLLGLTQSYNARNINIVLSSTLPPMLNPIIYSLKTEEIWEHLSKVFKMQIISPTIIKP
ncbi:olfactory receptor 2AT4-like [Latimeria chalumnae]|uniref:olfactory receptor 2AT4-like n=1 Tax=Latimeria chalumnae TaxID=7897 RepID=UPI00313B66DB